LLLTFIHRIKLFRVKRGLTLLYLISSIPVLLLVFLVLSIIRLNKRIDELEEKIATGYAPILSDLHRRIEELEREKK
jgi:hypothetical protein